MKLVDLFGTDPSSLRFSRYGVYSSGKRSSRMIFPSDLIDPEEGASGGWTTGFNRTASAQVLVPGSDNGPNSNASG